MRLHRPHLPLPSEFSSKSPGRRLFPCHRRGFLFYASSSHTTFSKQPILMTTQVRCLPSRKWSIVALSSAGLATVIFSYLLAIALALGCLSLPVVLLVAIPSFNGSLLFTRLLLSAFGAVAGLTILWSLLPRANKVQVNGIPINLRQEGRLAQEIAAIAAALREPMPSEVYLIGEANAFVAETGEFLNTRRIMGVGLPLLQMLTVEQIRAVLAHEFAHYYAGDTRLGPWVYNTRRAMARVYENLGKKSELLSFLRRWAVVAVPFMLLMHGMRIYWIVFMRITQSISRRQEFRSDELACYIAGSQALVGGLENIAKCQAAVPAYWNSVVFPAAMSGFQPELAGGLMRFMQAPRIVKATSEFLAKQSSTTTTSPLDTHPPLNKRIERAQFYALPVPASSGRANQSNLPAISLIDDLAPLETSLLRKLIPAATKTELKPLDWETAGAEIYVPMWRKQIAGFLPVLSTTRLADLPALVLEPRPIARIVYEQSRMRLNQAQCNAKALEVLFCALTLCLLDGGWKLVCEPGATYLESGGNKVEPGGVISAIKSGKMSVTEWEAYRAERGLGNWPLGASLSPQPIS